MTRKFTMPGTVWLGENALRSAGDDICKLGKRALVVTGNAMVRQGHIKKLTELLEKHQVNWVLYSDISGEPTDSMVEAGTKLYYQEQCDFVIGFGGGSPLDAAKAIALMARSKLPLSECMGREIDWRIPPIAAIPSTAGTGSEVTQFTIITDTKSSVKMLLKGSSLMPAVAVIDPIFTIEAPENVTVATGLDALTHAVEAYTSKRAFEQSDRYSLSAIKRIFKYLPMAVKEPDHLLYREQMSLAAYEAGVGFNNSSVTLVHGMSRPIGVLFHVPHGLSNAMLLKECLAFALDGATERFAVIARVIGVAIEKDCDRTAAESFMQALEELLQILHVPTLNEYGISREEFVNSIPKMAADAMESGSPANTRKEVSIVDIETIYNEVISY